MSGVSLLARVSATLESRLSCSSSASSSSSSRYRAHGRRNGRRGAWTLALIPHARGTASQVLKGASTLRQQGSSRSGADLLLVRALSSTSTAFHSRGSPPRDDADSLETDADVDEINAEIGHSALFRPVEIVSVGHDSTQQPPQQSIDGIGHVRSSDGPMVGETPDGFPTKHSDDREAGPDYKILLSQSLRQGRPADILKAIVVASEDAEYLQTIPDNTFSEILIKIQPQKVIAWVDIIRRTFHPNMIRKLGVTPPDSNIDAYLRAILKVVINRKDASRHLNVNDYAALLATAHSVRSKPFAKTLWKSMLADEVTPDLRCYNHYLGAIVENAGNYSKALNRVTDFNRAARLQKTLGIDFTNYSLGEGGIKEEALTVLDQVLKSDMSPDAETFRLLILAVGREGDLGTVRSILKTVWSVDVVAVIGSDDEGQLSSRKDIPYSSPVRPNGGTLHAIAHAFGINNDISTAIRVVDYLSRVFDIVIPMKVWEELFEQTFEHSLPRSGQKKFTVGQVSKDSLLKLWTTMTGKPYNIQPSMLMYDRLIKILFTLCRTQDMWTYMQEGHRVYGQHQLDAEKAYKKLQTANKLHAAYEGNSAMSVDKQRSRFLLNELVRKRDRVLVGRWLRLLLASMRSWHRVDKDQSWSTVQIPEVLRQMRPFAPHVVNYEIPGGQVRMLFRQRDNLYQSQKKVLKARRRKDRTLRITSGPPGAQMRLGRKHYQWMSSGSSPGPKTKD